jgi:hypothetical protein
MLHAMTKKKIIFIVLVLLTALSVILFFVFSEENTEQTPQTWQSQLTGENVSESSANKPILGVMYNNSPEARPQSGLASAGIVFEATTEGGITRYLAFFQDDMPDRIGPIRSLRQHFLDWAMGFDSSIVHVGGSQQLLDLVEDRNAKSLNQFKYPEPFYRTDDRSPPHNMYARTSDLSELQASLDHENSSFSQIPRSSESPAEDPTTQTISVDYLSSVYSAEFRYNRESNAYERYLGSQPHTDEITGDQIAVKNVIVLRLSEPAPIQALGNGQAFLFKNGTVVEAKWEVEDYTKRLRILASDDGEEIPLNIGKTWISVITPENDLQY